MDWWRRTALKARCSASQGSEHDEERSLGEKLLAELHSFVGDGWEQEDDITLLTLRRFVSLS
jgi:hypothetical protein